MDVCNILMEVHRRERDPVQETLLHLFRDCNASGQVWQHLQMDCDPRFYTAACIHWLVTNINSPRLLEEPFLLSRVGLFGKTEMCTLIFLDNRWSTWLTINRADSLCICNQGPLASGTNNT
ncbi:hypothetical protein JHK84_042894 [Glycine max]|nr:hypothetical protein JHK84_042894 [Glycine max]